MKPTTKLNEKVENYIKTSNYLWPHAANYLIFLNLYLKSKQSITKITNHQQFPAVLAAAKEYVILKVFKEKLN